MQLSDSQKMHFEIFSVSLDANLIDIVLWDPFKTSGVSKAARSRSPTTQNKNTVHSAFPVKILQSYM